MMFKSELLKVSKKLNIMRLIIIEKRILAGKILMAALIAGLCMNFIFQIQAKPGNAPDAAQVVANNEDAAKEQDKALNKTYTVLKAFKVSNTETGIIIASNVNLRNESSTSSKVVSNLNKRDKVSIIDRSGQWAKVLTSRGDMGWVNSSLIGKKESDVRPDEKKVPMGQQVAEYSKKFLGVKYVWGGTTPKGFDCSGLVKYVYAKYGVTLNRVASDQASQGTKVARKDLKAGDLVFFDTDGGRNYINHVGIYLGGGRFIEASSGRSTGRVVIADMSSGFYSDAFITARRIFK